MRMHGERPAEELGGLLELPQHQMAESLARERAEMMGIARERLPTIRDRAIVVLREIADGRALVPPLSEGRRFLDETREGRCRGGQVLTLHRLDAVTQETVESRIARAMPHLPEGVRGARRLGDVVAAQSGQRFTLG